MRGIIYPFGPKYDAAEQLKANAPSAGCFWTLKYIFSTLSAKKSRATTPIVNQCRLCFTGKL
jgi:hypothetical protein